MRTLRLDRALGAPRYPGAKRCPGCRRVLPINSFGPADSDHTYVHEGCYCRECVAADQPRLDLLTGRRADA